MGKPNKVYDGIVYVGRTRVVPPGIVINHGQIYQAEILPPDFGFTHFQLRVLVDSKVVTIPYGCTADIWEEWMPHERK